MKKTLKLSILVFFSIFLAMTLSCSNAEQKEKEKQQKAHEKAIRPSQFNTKDESRW